MRYWLYFYFSGEPMTIIAHNAAFDISFLKKMFVDAGNQMQSTISNNPYDYNNMFSRNAIDIATMALILRLQGRLEFDCCSLDNILKHYAIPTENVKRHSALDDARQTAKAFISMFNDLSSPISTDEPNKNEESASYDDGFR